MSRVATGARRKRFVATGAAEGLEPCGAPGQVTDGIKSTEAKYTGLDDFTLPWAESLSPNGFEDQLRWFACGVMPAFTGG
jgi:hypothetical protein